MSGTVICPHARRTDLPCPYFGCHAAATPGVELHRMGPSGRERYGIGATRPEGVDAETAGIDAMNLEWVRLPDPVLKRRDS